MMVCTRCAGSGFLNLHQIDDSTRAALEASGFDPECPGFRSWLGATDAHDVKVCDCCGDGDTWHGVPGQHYSDDDRPGSRGTYAYNGGFCECH